MSHAAIKVDSVKTYFGSSRVHDGISFEVKKGTIVALIGGSGSGKSVLLKEIIGLLRPTSGRIEVLGTDVWRCSMEELQQLRNRFGVLFQNGALFSALTVSENVSVPLREQTTLSASLISDIVKLRLSLTGLAPDVAVKMPSELSGGMLKRVALARSLALEPELLFLDEPTSGLDPINARAFDRQIVTLRDSLGLTVFMVTHDLDTLFGIADQIIILGEGRVLADGSIDAVRNTDHPWINAYFENERIAS